jgi:hypothetical protein
MADTIAAFVLAAAAVGLVVSIVELLGCGSPRC